jgi:hypothetical protein
MLVAAPLVLIAAAAAGAATGAALMVLATQAVSAKLAIVVATSAHTALGTFVKV